MARDEIERLYGLGLISDGEYRRARQTMEEYADDYGMRPGPKGSASRSEIDDDDNQNAGSGFSNPERDYGPNDAGELDSKPNRRADKESKISNARDVLDRPVIADEGRMRAVLADQWSPDWYSDASWKGK
jgi:hypothetical protein